MSPATTRTPTGLSADELIRYSRHLALDEVGLEGQRRFRDGRVLLVGAGGLGSPAALYLAAAGVGHVGIVDFDAVDASNLQRQIAHGTAAVGRPKLDSVRERLGDLNPHVEVIPHPVHLDRTNALDVIRGYDVVLDGTDNFPTRYLVNDACALLAKPYVYGSILRFEGQASVFDAAHGPCYRCLFPEPPPPGTVPNCAEAGVLGVLPGVIGAIQANEALKILLGAGTTLLGRLLLYDAWTLEFRELTIRKDPACPLCGEHPTIRELVDYEDFCGLREAPAPAAERITVQEYRLMRERGDDHVLLDVREGFELAIARLGGETHIPLRELAQRAGELDRARPIVALCHHGNRSRTAVRWLREHGFARAADVIGGIEAWSCDVDPGIPRY